MIVRAAVKYSGGEVIEGYDYGFIHFLASKLGLSEDGISGFVTSSGKFVLPDKAATIAVKSGQVSDSLEELEPENLWPPMDL